VDRIVFYLWKCRDWMRTSTSVSEVEVRALRLSARERQRPPSLSLRQKRTNFCLPKVPFVYPSRRLGISSAAGLAYHPTQVGISSRDTSRPCISSRASVSPRANRFAHLSRSLCKQKRNPNLKIGSGYSYRRVY